MAHSSECRDSYARKMLDTADIVRDAMFQQSSPEAMCSLVRRPGCELSRPGLEVAQPLEALTAYTLRMTQYGCSMYLPTSQRKKLVYMFAETRNHLDARVLPLLNAVFCLDCEVISSSRSDECPSCKSRSLVSLARMLGGSLFARRAQHFQELE